MADKTPIRIKLTGGMSDKEVRYIHQDKRGYWCLTGASGTPLALCDVLADRDEMALKFELDDAPNASAAVKCVRARLSSLWKAEIHSV